MVTLSWAEIDGLVDLLARALVRRRFDAVVGISRSGLIPAVMLSHWLNVRAFGILDIRRTESDEVRAAKRPPQVEAALNANSLRDRHVLLVDDIVGEGATVRAARTYLQGRCASVTTAVLVLNFANFGSEEPATVVDLFACAVHDWVIFPWEGKGQDLCSGG